MLLLLAATALQPATAAASSDPGRFTVVATMRSGDRVLWTGPLLVAMNSATSWSQSRNEPADPSCASRNYYSASTEMSLMLSPVPADAQGPVRMTVNARWTRAAESLCDGTRTVETAQVVALPDSGAATIRGDAGLSVEIRRASGG